VESWMTLSCNITRRALTSLMPEMNMPQSRLHMMAIRSRDKPNSQPMAVRFWIVTLLVCPALS
jgi:hypothetical protein